MNVRMDGARWTAAAACLDGDTGLWFARHRDDVDEAKAVCRRCPVRDDCLSHALAANEQHGIWGGLDETERAAIRRRHGRSRHGR